MRTLIDDGPTTDMGFCKGALSSNPLWPGKSAGLKPAIVEATFDASAPADPIPGSAEMALGIPPIGKESATVGVINCNDFGAAVIGNWLLANTFGITVESWSEIDPLVLVNWNTGNEIFFSKDISGTSVGIESADNLLD